MVRGETGRRERECGSRARESGEGVEWGGKVGGGGKCGGRSSKGGGETWDEY